MLTALLYYVDIIAKLCRHNIEILSTLYNFALFSHAASFPDPLPLLGLLLRRVLPRHDHIMPHHEAGLVVASVLQHRAQSPVVSGHVTPIWGEASVGVQRRVAPSPKNAQTTGYKRKMGKAKK